MKIGLVQYRPTKGNVEENISSHVKAIQQATAYNVDAIFFPELSITGYEPELAGDTQVKTSDVRLSIFQQLSDLHNIIIAIGAPTVGVEKPNISMIIYKPFKKCSVYSKQILHDDEKAYFEVGHEQVLIEIGKEVIAPAICYESLQASHLAYALEKGATLYLASVAKSHKGIEKAKHYFPVLAHQNKITILMSNCIGSCDNFISAGQSSIWDNSGNLLTQLDESEERILIYDTEHNTAFTL